MTFECMSTWEISHRVNRRWRGEATGNECPSAWEISHRVNRRQRGEATLFDCTSVWKTIHWIIKTDSSLASSNEHSTVWTSWTININYHSLWHNHPYIIWNHACITYLQYVIIATCLIIFNFQILKVQDTNNNKPPQARPKDAQHLPSIISVCAYILLLPNIQSIL